LVALHHHAATTVCIGGNTIGYPAAVTNPFNDPAYLWPSSLATAAANKPSPLRSTPTQPMLKHGNNKETLT